MIGLIATVALLSFAQAQRLCGGASNCVDANFKEGTQLPTATSTSTLIDTTRFKQYDDAVTGVATFGKWRRNAGDQLVENSGIRSDSRQLSCTSTKVKGTTLIFKRARSVAQLKRVRWYFRVQFALTDADGWGGVVFAYSGPNNHFRVAMRPNDQCISLQKKENGNWFTVARAISLAERLETNRAYEIAVTYGERDINVQVVNSNSRVQVVSFNGKARSNDLAAWKDKDVGVFSSANSPSEPVKFRNWMFVSASRLEVIKQFQVIVPTPTVPVPADCPDNTVCAECTVSQWGAYTECSSACDGGIRTRFRAITAGAELPCTLDLSESVTCNEQACAAVQPLNDKQKKKFKALKEDFKKAVAKAAAKSKKFTALRADLEADFATADRKAAKFENRVSEYEAFAAQLEAGEVGFRELRALMEA